LDFKFGVVHQLGVSHQRGGVIEIGAPAPAIARKSVNPRAKDSMDAKNTGMHNIGVGPRPAMIVVVIHE